MSRLGSTAARLKLKGIDGGPHKRWSMWFNSKQREEPYLGLTCWCKPVETSAPLRSASTGAAWLSSARVVRCWVKSRNERNPRSQLPASHVGDSGGTAGVKPEEGGDDVKSSRPYRPGRHPCYNAWYTPPRPREGSQSLKAGLSSDCSLQLDCMKPESLVIADQPRRGEYVPGPCTHRPSRHGSRRDPKPVGQPQGGSRLRSIR